MAALRASLLITALTSNGSGTTTGSHYYTAYGRYRGGSELGTENRYTSQKLDGTGLYYYNARYYDPQLGTFLSPDTIVPDETNLFDYNRYMYGYGNPLKYNDPTGHCPWCIGAVGGGAVGGGLYLWNENQQKDGIDLSINVTWEDGWLPEVHGGDDWADLGTAVGGGAVAGALIATPGASAYGVSMATNLVSNQVGNLITGEDFSKGSYVTTAGVAGAVQTATGGYITNVASKVINNHVVASKVGSTVNAALVGAGDTYIGGTAAGKSVGASDILRGSITNGAQDLINSQWLDGIYSEPGWGTSKTFIETYTNLTTSGIANGPGWGYDRAWPSQDNKKK